MKPTDFAFHLTNFLSKYLPGRRNLSPNTIKSYRDTFMLLLMFLRDEKGILAEKVTLAAIDSSIIEGFLDWLNTARKNSESTQNQRLAAIHAFFRYVMNESPDMLFQSQKILGIEFKTCPKPMVGFVSENTLSKILRSPDSSNPNGRRDLTLLSVLYDTGARVSELADLKVRDIRLEKPAVVKLTGKGNKTRFVSLLPQTAVLVENYLTEQGLCVIKTPDHPVFFNRQGKRLTRAGIAYILAKYAGESCDDLTSGKVTPHIIRHTKAMHLLRADVNLIYIRDLLGHSQVSTTEIYARADVEMKRKALEKSQNNVIPQETPSWNKDQGFMAYLSDLCK